MKIWCSAPSVAHLPFIVSLVSWMERGLPLCPGDARPVAPLLEVVRQCFAHQSLTWRYCAQFLPFDFFFFLVMLNITSIFFAVFPSSLTYLFLPVNSKVYKAGCFPSFEEYLFYLFVSFQPFQLKKSPGNYLYAKTSWNSSFWTSSACSVWELFLWGWITCTVNFLHSQNKSSQDTSHDILWVHLIEGGSP